MEKKKLKKFSVFGEYMILHSKTILPPKRMAP
jgi:hypothetical protein